MKFLRSITIAFAAISSLAFAGVRASILDGPGYSFSIQTPKGWQMTSTKSSRAAFYPADQTFESSPVYLYVRSINKSQRNVTTIEELNQLDLAGIQKRHPKAISKKIGTVTTSACRELPIYSLSSRGHFERVAYADEPNTITVFVLNSKNDAGLKSAEKAFRELIASYYFILENTELPQTKSDR